MNYFILDIAIGSLWEENIFILVTTSKVESGRKLLYHRRIMKRPQKKNSVHNTLVLLKKKCFIAFIGYLGFCDFCGRHAGARRRKKGGGQVKACLSAFSKRA